MASTNSRLALPKSNLRRDHKGLNSFIRDAKGQSLDLKTVLKRKDPWDREVEFQRESLRKTYLQIIFTSAPTSSSSSRATSPTSAAIAASAPPPSPSSSHTSRLLNVLNLLWLETSHSIIHIYRSKLSEMDRQIAEAPTAHRGSASRGRGASGGQAGAGRANNIPGPTARRRLIHSFRTFLAQEEEFFRTLLSRLAASLLPSDIAGMRSLGIVPPSLGRDQDPSGDGRVGGGEFGEEGEPVELSESEKKARRAAAVPLAHKALIFFGDIARYRELYSEPGGIGGAASAKTGGDRKKGGAEGGSSTGERRVKNWAKAGECYTQARLLIPDNGNPSNQLAVLSQYSSDFVSSIYHYHRALSVRNPFPTARTNLEVAYSKAISRYFGNGEVAAGEGEGSGDEGERFKRCLVVLHGLYFMKTKTSEIPALELRVQELFKVSVEERLLTSDLIVKTVVTGLCALWDARIFRSGGKKSEKTATQESSQDPSQTPSPSTSAPVPNLEPHLLIHILSLYRNLLTIGESETSELVKANGGHQPWDSTTLALNISAVLRRTLPALRIMSKWLKGQLDYINRVESRLEAREQRHRSSTSKSTTTAADEHRVSLAQIQETIHSFWTAYADFSNVIQDAFPLELLPDTVVGEVWLEEDVDLLGFAPLRRGMKDEGTKTSSMEEIARVGKNVHPNEEQLMRIADIQMDARLMAQLETCILGLASERFIVQDAESPEAIEAAKVAAASEQIALAFGNPSQGVLSTLGEDDEASEEDDRQPLHELEEVDEGDEEATDDDPVDLAMRIATANRMEMGEDSEEEEDDDEEIVYAGLSLSASSLQPTPPPAPSTRTPVGSVPRTAGGLLQQILAGGNLKSSTPGSGLAQTMPPPPTNARSIWAPTDGLSGNPFTSTSSSPVAAAESFESLPNTTHQAFGPVGTSFSRHQSFSASAGGLPAPASLSNPSLQPNLTNSPSLFGSFSPFTNPGSPSNRPPVTNAIPIPSHQTFNPPSVSDLSPHANAFTSSSPRRHTAGPPGLTPPTGWPPLPTNHPYPA